MNEQEQFWAGDFGNEYSGRNKDLMRRNTALFSEILKKTNGVRSVMELGCGTGMNLTAIKNLKPNVEVMGVELNSQAVGKCPVGTIFNQSVFDMEVPLAIEIDLIFTKGLLIHIFPDDLGLVYDKLYRAGSRYILMCEYYNPTPVEVAYRGHRNKLWKRDFAGEFMNAHPDIQLVDYGFVYHRDTFPQDDLTWFLMERRQYDGKA